METITLSKKDYVELRQKADVNEDLLQKLIRGLEDIKAGRVKLWKKSNDQSTF